MKMKTRREFLKGASLLAGGVILAACAPKATEAPTTAPTEAPKEEKPTEAPKEEKPTETPKEEKPTEAPTEEPTPEPTPTPEPVVIRVLMADQPQLEPQLHAGGNQANLCENIYETLVAFSVDGTEIVPELAVSWERVNDYTFKFNLREGVTFHSGDPFTAEAVKYSMERYNEANEAPQLSQYPWGTTTIESDYVVTVEHKEQKSDPIFLKRFAGIGGHIVNPRFAEEVGLEGMRTSADGTGPYKVEAYDRDGEIVLAANEKHWNGKPAIDKVIQTAVVEPATRVASLLAGEVDFADAIPPEQVPVIESSKLCRIESTPTNRVVFYPFIVNKPIAENKLVRQACNYASNFEAIIEFVLAGRGDRVNALMLPQYFGYNPNLKPYPDDVEKAKALLTEAGFPNGVKLNMVQLVGRLPNDKEVGEALVGELKRAGIDITINLVEIGAAGPVLWENPNPEHDLYSISWGNGFMDGGYGMDYFVSTSFFSTKSTQYNNPEFDKLMEDAAFELDEEKRRKLYEQADALLYEDCPAIWAYAVHRIYGVSKRLNMVPRPTERVNFFEMSVNA